MVASRQWSISGELMMIKSAELNQLPGMLVIIPIELRTNQGEIERGKQTQFPADGKRRGARDERPVP